MHQTSAGAVDGPLYPIRGPINSSMVAREEQEDTPLLQPAAGTDTNSQDLDVRIYRSHSARSRTYRVVRCIGLVFLFFILLGGIATAVVLGLIVLAHEAHSTGEQATPVKGGGVLGTHNAWIAPERQNSATGYYKEAAVASESEECSEIGRDVLRSNGSVVDVAISTLLCVGLHNPQSSGIGGGDVMLIYERPHGQEEKVFAVLDAREVAPLAATADMFSDVEGDPKGGLSIGVPGEMMGFYQAWKRFGRLPWRRLFEPAIRLCKEGILVGEHLAQIFRRKEDIIRREPSLREIFVKSNGDLLQAEDKMIRQKLAKTLETVAEEGATTFYTGELADQVAMEIQGFDGIITKEDLENYHSKWREPYLSQLGDYFLVTAPPPFGGPIYQFILKLMSKYNLDQDSLTTTEDQILFYHRLIEAMKFGYAMKTRLGDPGFTNLTKILDGLRSENFVDYIHSKMDDNTTHNVLYYDPQLRPAKEGGTSHLSVLAPDGAAVSATSTINSLFGSERRGQLTGIIYNDEMGDFNRPSDEIAEGYLVPEVNLIEPQKRPLSSMCPVLAFDENGNLVHIIGGTGGKQITGIVASVSLHSLLLGQTVNSSMDKRRVVNYLIPNVVKFEAGFPKDILEGLQEKGHDLVEESTLSVVQAIEVDCDKSPIAGSCITAASDWRKQGAPSGF